MEFRQRYILSFKLIFTLGFFAISFFAKSQIIVRQSLGSGGGSFTSNGITVQSAVGQSSSTNSTIGVDGVLRQGFIQPPVKSLLIIHSAPSVLIYPNPSTGHYHIKMDFEPGDFYKIYNIIGDLIREESVSTYSPLQSLNLFGNAEGIYTVTIFRKNTSIKTTKIILSK